MKRMTMLLCGVLGSLWMVSAHAVGPGAATRDQPQNANATVKIDRQAAQNRLEQKGKRSQKLDKARKPAHPSK